MPMDEKDVIATFGAPRDSLTGDKTDGPCNRDTLVEVADRAIVRSEFVICYEQPIDDPYTNQASQRGYITVWWKDTDGYYYRKQMLSGDNRWMLKEFSSLAKGDTDRIEKFIAKSEVPQS